MAFDITSVISSVAPTLATMLGGPLAGTAVLALENAFGLAPGDKTAGLGGVAAVVQAGGMTPEIIASMRAADQRHAELLEQQGIDLVKINSAHVEALGALDVADRTNARQSNSNKDATWWIACSILGTFAVIMVLVLYGCWSILSGGITIKDVSVVAAISGLIGSVVGYVAANAQTVVNFIFGGSLGSQKKSDDMAGAVTQAITAATK